MKKLLATTAVLALCGTGSAFAQATDNATLDMAAEITERCEVSLVGTNPNVLFGQDQTVANIDTVCNLPGVVQLRISSANGGILDSGSDTIDYTIDVLPNNVGPNNISGGGDNLPIATPVDLFAPAGAVLGGLQVDLRINVDGVANNGASLLAGTYTDTLTVEIGPNGF